MQHTSHLARMGAEGKATVHAAALVLFKHSYFNSHAPTCTAIAQPYTGPLQLRVTHAIWCQCEGDER